MCGGGGAPKIPPPKPPPPPPPILVSKKDLDQQKTGNSKTKRKGRNDLVVDLLPSIGSSNGLSIPS